jgi:cytoskeletal protein CcmA (bactofilin family)
VQLCSGAVVRGDIIHASLGIDTGSTFEGVSKRSQDPQAEAKAALTKRNGAAADTGRHSSPSQ